MNGEQAMYVAMLLLALTLPLSALLRRRIGRGRAIKLGLLWVAIIGGLLLAVRIIGFDRPVLPTPSRTPISFT